DRRHLLVAADPPGRHSALGLERIVHRIPSLFHVRHRLRIGPVGPHSRGARGMDARDGNHAARDDEPAAPRGRMTPLRPPVLLVLMGLALMLAAALPAAGQEIDVQNTPVLLQADELIYNEDLGVVTARGN